MDHAFPMSKLGGLLVRQMSSPIAARIKVYAKNHPLFRRTICMPVAQFYHSAELRYKMWLHRLGRPQNLPVISEQQAINLGGDILGEGIIFFIGGLVLTLEFMRQATKQEEKVLAERKRWTNLLDALEDLKGILAGHQNDIDKMLEQLHNYKPPDGNQPHKPPDGSSPENPPDGNPPEQPITNS